jgi:hypothetical protein
MQSFKLVIRASITASKCLAWANTLARFSCGPDGDRGLAAWRNPERDEFPGAHLSLSLLACAVIRGGHIDASRRPTASEASLYGQTHNNATARCAAIGKTPGHKLQVVPLIRRLIAPYSELKLCGGTDINLA